MQITAVCTTSLHCFLSQCSSTPKHKYIHTCPCAKYSFIYKLNYSALQSTWVRHRICHLSSSRMIEPSSATFTRGTRSGPSWLSSPFSSSSSSSSSWSGVLFSSCLQFLRQQGKVLSVLNCCSVCQTFNNLMNHPAMQHIKKYVNFETCFSIYCKMEICKTSCWKQNVF